METCRYLDVLGVGPWFPLNTLLGGTRFSPTLVAISDRYLVLLSRSVERFAGAPFGKNLIMVATKPQV